MKERLKKILIWILLIGDDVVPTTRFNRLSRFCEIVALLTLAYLLYGLIIGFAGYGPKWYVTTVAALVCALASVASVWCGFKALESIKPRTFCVSERCLETLKALNIPPDVYKYLEGFSRYDEFKGEEEFVKALQNRLGYERTNEFRNVILKYARGKAPVRPSMCACWWFPAN